MKNRTQKLNTLTISIMIALAAGCASEKTDPVDNSLAVTLSADAAPTVAAQLQPLLHQGPRSWEAWLASRFGVDEGDIRSWSWSRWRARRALQSIPKRVVE